MREREEAIRHFRRSSPRRPGWLSVFRPGRGADDAGRVRSRSLLALPYVGGRGWIGCYLDGSVDWDELDDIVLDAYLTVAPARLHARVRRAWGSLDAEPDAFGVEHLDP